MILSMTGFGEVQHDGDGVAYVLEIRSLNNRYFKAAIKLPEHLSVFESEVEKLLRRALGRGSVTYTLRVRNTSAEAAQEINAAAVKRYLEQLSGITENGQARIDLATILSLPGVCQPPVMDEETRRRQWVILERMTLEGIDRVTEMRRVEGEALHEDLMSQCRSIREHLAAVQALSPDVLRGYHEKLVQRVNELLGQGALPLKLDDVKREVAVYAERCDINEEVARLSSHLDQFERLCDGQEPAGRKLDFLAQETLREANTIGSKANDATIAHHVVEIKGAIDRLKEQVQNVA